MASSGLTFCRPHRPTAERRLPVHCCSPQITVYSFRSSHSSFFFQIVRAPFFQFFSDRHAVSILFPDCHTVSFFGFLQMSCSFPFFRLSYSSYQTTRTRRSRLSSAGLRQVFHNAAPSLAPAVPLSLGDIGNLTVHVCLDTMHAGVQK